MNAPAQLPLFDSEPLWSDLMVHYDRRRRALDRLVRDTAALISPADRRAAASDLNLPFPEESLAFYPDYKRRLDQHCIFRRTGRSVTPVERHLEESSAEIEGDTAEAVRHAVPILLSIRSWVDTHGCQTVDAMTGSRILVIDPRIRGEAKRGDVFFARLVRFPEYAMLLDVAAAVGSGEWEHLRVHLAQLVEALRTDRAALASTHPEEFEIACLRSCMESARLAEDADEAIRRDTALGLDEFVTDESPTWADGPGDESLIRTFDLYRRRRDVMDDVIEGFSAVVRWLDLVDAAARFGVRVDFPSVPAETALHCAVESLLFSQPEGAPGPLEEFADENPFPPGSDEQHVLRAMTNAWPSIWQVSRVLPGIGLRVTDLWSEEDNSI